MLFHRIARLQDRVMHALVTTIIPFVLIVVNQCESGESLLP